MTAIIVFMLSISWSAAGEVSCESPAGTSVPASWAAQLDCARIETRRMLSAPADAAGDPTDLWWRLRQARMRHASSEGIRREFEALAAEYEMSSPPRSVPSVVSEALDEAEARASLDQLEVEELARELEVRREGAEAAAAPQQQIAQQLDALLTKLLFSAGESHLVVDREAWCDLHLYGGIVRALAGGPGAEQRFRDAAVAWRSQDGTATSCRLGELHQVLPADLLLQVADARMEAADEATGSILIDDTLEASWLVDGSPVTVIDGSIVDLRPGLHRVERVAEGGSWSTLVTLVGGECLAMVPEDTTLSPRPGFGCGGVQPRDWHRAHDGEMPEDEDIDVVPVEQARQAVSFGWGMQLNGGASIGSTGGATAHGGVDGEVAVRFAKGTVGPAVAISVNRHTRPLARTGIDGVVRTNAWNVDAGIGLDALVDVRRVWVAVQGLVLLDAVSADVGGRVQLAVGGRAGSVLLGWHVSGRGYGSGFFGVTTGPRVAWDSLRRER
jgi:hypothetical protein